VNDFTSTGIAGTVGLNVDTLDVERAITSDRLSESDLVAGLFDNAALIEFYRVNWQDTDQRVLMLRQSRRGLAGCHTFQGRGEGACARVEPA
jgi:hypothetical protein